MTLRGVDLSEHNGSVDFSALKEAGASFAILRLGYGSDYAHQDDSRFAENVRKAEAAALPWGAYLYSYAKTTEMAQSEAQHALRLLGGKKPLYGVWYDLEDPQIAGAGLVATAQTFCSALEDAGLYAGIYASLSWLNGPLNSPQLDRYDKWVAQWNSRCTYQKPYGIWQYTDRWVIGGKHYDGNWAYKDYPALIKAMDSGQTKEEWKMTEEFVRSAAEQAAQKALEDTVAAQAAKPVPDWAEDAVAQVKEAGILNGDKEGTFRPQSWTTRAELAQALVNLLRSPLLEETVAAILRDLLGETR